MSMRKQIFGEIVEMLVLSIEYSLLRACHLRRRYCCGSKKDRGYYGMEYADKCPGSV
jgi:hypothetical protein